MSGGYISYLPHSEEFDEKVIREAGGEHLRDDIDIASQGTLQHDGHVWGVKEFDREAAALSSDTLALDGYLDAESLEVYDNGKNNGGSE